jgi:chemotaxis protein CheD
MQREGARIEDLVAKMVGGARMFYFNGENSHGIGEQNIAYMQENLRKEGVPLIGKDIGGHHGRSIEFYLDSGRVIVKAVGIEDKEI